MMSAVGARPGGGQDPTSSSLFYQLESLGMGAHQNIVAGANAMVTNYSNEDMLQKMGIGSGGGFTIANMGLPFTLMQQKQRQLAVSYAMTHHGLPPTAAGLAPLAAGTNGSDQPAYANTAAALTGRTSDSIYHDNIDKDRFASFLYRGIKNLGTLGDAARVPAARFDADLLHVRGGNLLEFDHGNLIDLADDAPKVAGGADDGNNFLADVGHWWRHPDE